MAESNEIDYGPLTGLIGVWKGDKGFDLAPEPDGQEENPYYETITYIPIGDVTNADEQILVALHYRQIVKRKSNDKIFHDETGYLMWESKTGTIMHSLLIPRAVGVLAGGNHSGVKDSDGNVVMEFFDSLDDKKWQIIQSPFMMQKAQTKEFRHKIIVGNGRLSYFETTVVDIYGKTFDHTDENELVLQ